MQQERATACLSEPERCSWCLEPAAHRTCLGSGHTAQVGMQATKSSAIEAGTASLQPGAQQQPAANAAQKSAKAKSKTSGAAKRKLHAAKLAAEQADKAAERHKSDRVELKAAPAAQPERVQWGAASATTKTSPVKRRGRKKVKQAAHAANAALEHDMIEQLAGERGKAKQAAYAANIALEHDMIEQLEQGTVAAPESKLPQFHTAASSQSARQATGQKRARGIDSHVPDAQQMPDRCASPAAQGLCKLMLYCCRPLPTFCSVQTIVILQPRPAVRPCVCFTFLLEPTGCQFALSMCTPAGEQTSHYKPTQSINISTDGFKQLDFDVSQAHHCPL